MRKATLLALSLSAFLYGNSQQVDYDVSLDHVNAKVKLPPTVKLLGDDLKYQVAMPATLAYNTSSREIEAIRAVEYTINLDAKRAKKADVPDYTFKFTSAGLKPSPVTETTYFEETRAQLYPNPPAVIKGQVIRIKYTMPVILEVVNKEGKVEHTYNFNADGGTVVYHKDFLGTFTYNWNPVLPTTPFANAQDAMNAFKKSENEIYKRAEIIAWFQTMLIAEKLITLSYGTYKLQENIFFYHELSKKGKSAMPALAEVIEKTKDYIGDLDDEKKYEASLTGLKDLLPAYDSIINHAEAYGPKLQRLALSNAAWIALVNGERERAASYFGRYYQSENDEYANGSIIKRFGTIFQDYHLRDLTKDSAPVTTVDDDIAYLYPEKIPVAKFDPATVNIERQEGQVEKENGETIKGKISMQYAAKSGGIVDMDLGKAATVYFEKNGGETYQFAKVNNTKRILIGQRVFEPVGRRNSALVGILKSTSGDFGNTYFMERVYEKDGYIVYKFWEPYETILIKHKDEDKAIGLVHILQSKKTAKKFEETCPGLEDFIKNNKLTKTQADAVKIVDFIAAGCK